MQRRCSGKSRAQKILNCKIVPVRWCQITCTTGSASCAGLTRASTSLELAAKSKDVDGRNKLGHDDHRDSAGLDGGVGCAPSTRSAHPANAGVQTSRWLRSVWPRSPRFRGGERWVSAPLRGLTEPTRAGPWRYCNSVTYGHRLQRPRVARANSTSINTRSQSDLDAR